MSTEKKERNDYIKELRHEKGWSLGEIAEHFELSVSRISDIVGKSNFMSTKKGRKKTDLAKQLVLSYPHLRSTEIARQANIHSYYIYKARKILGITEIDWDKRFWSRVAIGDKNDCWEWTGARTKKHPYGKCKYKGKDITAHRVSWTLTNGDIPNGKHVLHHCDNPPCVNPNHLYVGTQQDNMNDMVNRNRQRGKA